MATDDEDDMPTPEEMAAYWQGVTELEQWYHDLIATEFKHGRAGSGDTLMDLENLADRIKSETIEGVANGGFPEGMLYEDDFVEKYSEVCDVVERTYGGMPLEHLSVEEWETRTDVDNDPLFHTSSAARAAANRIFEILGITSVG